jgi:hypothetical protein
VTTSLYRTYVSLICRFALPPGFRRRLMVTSDGAGASHDLIARLDKLAGRPGYQLRPTAQAAMRALSVFPGGFTADAARHVTAHRQGKSLTSAKPTLRLR